MSDCRSLDPWTRHKQNNFYLYRRKISWWRKSRGGENLWIQMCGWENSILSPFHRTLYLTVSYLFINSRNRQSQCKGWILSVYRRKDTFSFLGQQHKFITGPLKFLHYLFCSKLGKSLEGKVYTLRSTTKAITSMIISGRLRNT